MSVLHDIKSDVLWVIQTLQTKGITDDVYSVLENIVQKTDLELPVSKKPAPLTTVPANWIPFASDMIPHEDALYDLIFAEQFSQNFIDGHEMPVKTPLKAKRPVKQVLEETMEAGEYRDEAIFAKPEQKSVPISAPKFTSMSKTESLPVPVDEKEIIASRKALSNRFSTHTVVKLREMLEKEHLPKQGKKSELVDRMVNQTLSKQYGSPRMRNSYQRAMTAPIPPREEPMPERPTSSLSMKSTKSVNSTTSLKSTKSSSSNLKAKPSLSKKSSSTRLRSPSPSQDGPSSLQRTPSFKSRIQNKFQNSPMYSPRLFSKTPSKLNLKAKTPSRVDLELKENDRAKRMDDLKKERDLELARKKTRKRKEG